MPSNAQYAQRGGQMRLARTGTANEHDILRGLSKSQIGQVVDQLSVDF